MAGLAGSFTLHSRLLSVCCFQGIRTQMMSSKTLVALDFDHTIIDDNSDIRVQKLSPLGKIPDEIQAKYSSRSWTKYMGEIFKYFHQSGIKKSDILGCMREIELTKGMPELLRHLADNDNETIVISDSNSVFIDCILEHNDLKETVDAVFTNPAVFDKSGLLTIDFYHTQDWCDLSTINLCKGQILEDYIKLRKSEGTEFNVVYYVGDGYNDLCPSLRLRSIDFACPRVNFKLWEKLQKAERENKDIGMKANVLPWSDAGTILDSIKMISRMEKDERQSEVI